MDKNDSKARQAQKPNSYLSKTDLQGVWTVLYVRLSSDWKIRVRHESFATFEENKIS